MLNVTSRYYQYAIFILTVVNFLKMLTSRKQIKKRLGEAWKRGAPKTREHEAQGYGKNTLKARVN